MSAPPSSNPSAANNSLPPDLEAAALAQLIEADQERRWAAGDRVAVEEYLQRYPQLRDQPQAVVALLFHEFRLRQQAGEQPQFNEFAARFPELAGPLRTLLGLNASLASVGAASSASEQRTVPPAAAPPATGGFQAAPPTAAPPTPIPDGSMAFPEVSGYTVLGVLGRGGMGVVYKAEQAGLRRMVALKMILHGDHVGDDERRRFQAEAEAIAALQHPHIVQVYEVGEHNGLPFFSMEFCPRGSLEGKLDGTPWEPERAAALVQTLAGAVQAAHQAGLVHRDLKPGNVLLAADGSPKVTDFGLVKRLDVAGQTQSGAVVGTPSYMAPEQAGGNSKDIGPAADVYALGAILYELLTGRPPFKAATPVDTVLQLLSVEPVPVRRLQPNTPRDIETICLKCLAKEPHRRYAAATALAEDLRRYQAGEPIQARPAGRLERTVKWARRRPALAALLGVTVLAFVALTVLSANLAVARNDAEHQALIAIGKEQEARQEAEKAKVVRDFLVSIFHFSDPTRKRGTINAREILDEADKRIERDFNQQPELRQELRTVIEQVYDKIGLVAPAAMILESRGSVQLHPVRGMNRAAAPQVLLYPGDQLQLGADATVQLIVLSDLHKERLEPSREAIVRRQGCEPPEAIRERAANIPMTFVRLPKGTFYMGWDGKKKGVKTEIKEDFAIAVHAVTQGQWQAVMGTSPSWFSRKGEGALTLQDISDEELKLFPVEQVSWNDVQAFLDKLNEKERTTGYRYRLPTEAEWEYACRGGATSEEECSYHFYFDKPTNELTSEQANFNGRFPFGKAGWGNWLERTTRVGAYPPNKLGLCDMHGNVWQWCDSLWKPEGPERVVRGGAWNWHGTSCLAGYRYHSEPSRRDRSLGFRLVSVPIR
jgi:formylglycine-generating enzyme required for sulfatase activity